MPLRTLATLLAIAALAAGCGASTSDSPDASVSATDARLAVEKAAGVKLTDTQLIEDGPKHGLLGSFANLDKVVTDRQLVMLLVLDEADKATEIRKQIASGLPAEAETLEHENTLVFYASQGKDRSAAIEKALSAL